MNDLRVPRNRQVDERPHALEDVGPDSHVVGVAVHVVPEVVLDHVFDVVVSIVLDDLEQVGFWRGKQDAAQHDCLALGCNLFVNAGEPVRTDCAIGVGERHDLAGGRVDARVAGGVDLSLGFGQQLHIRILLHDPRAGIRGTVVDEDELVSVPAEVLFQERFDTLPDIEIFVQERDDDGYFHLLGRMKEIINIGGLKVAPGEVEEVLLNYNGILEVAIIGVKSSNDISDERIKAFIVTDIELSIKDLEKFCLENMESYKLPTEFEIVKSLPKTPSGKIQRHLLI